MLDVIKKLDSNTIRGLIVVTIPLLVLIASFFGIDEAVFSAKLEGIGEKIVSLVALLGVAWAAYGRLFQPSPPLTDTAVKATAQRLVEEEAGRGQSGGPGVMGTGGGNALALILALGFVLTALPGCASMGIQPKGFNDRLASGYSLVTAVADSAGILLDGKLRVADMEPDATKREQLRAVAKANAQNLKDQAQQAKDALDIARRMRGINFDEADQRLASTLQILEALQRYLEEQT